MTVIGRGLRATRILPADGVAFNSHTVDGTVVVLAASVFPNVFSPGANSSAVHSSHLAEVEFAFDEALGLDLAERLVSRSVGVEDGFTIDAGAHHLVVLEVTVITALGTSGQFNVVDPNLIHVVVHIVESDVHVLASVCAQVDAVRTPVLITIGIVTHFSLGTRSTLGTAAPNLREVAS